MKINFGQNFEKAKEVSQHIINPPITEQVLTTSQVLGSIHLTMQKFASMGRNDYEIPTLMQLANDLQNGKITALEAEKKRAGIESAKDAYDYN